jgi:hypothetical protein
MTLLIQLGSPTLALPSAIAAFDCIQINTPHTINTLAQATALLNTTTSTPDYILGLNSTPSLLCLAAITRWPNTPYLLQEENAWLDVASGQYWPQTTVESAPTDIEDNEFNELFDGSAQSLSVDIESNNEAKPTPAQASPQKINTPSTVQADGTLLFDVFKFASWGEEGSENKAQIEHILIELALRNVRDSTLLDRAKKMRNLGNHAYNLWQGCEKRLKQHGETAEFTTWFNQQKQTANPKVANALTLKLKRWQEWQQKVQQRAIHPVIKSTFVPVILQNNQPHPNSLRHLPAHSQWQILIDETGSDFAGKSLGIHDTQLGRVVALALPVGLATLPPLAKGFHSTEELSSTLDNVLQTLVNASVGIVGITVKDNMVGDAPSWFSSIYTLVRLVMRLLPVQCHGQSGGKVEFIIEQRSGFNDTVSLLSIQQLLESELKSLDKTRFEHITMTMRFAKKDEHPANGYVDALAYTWATSNQASCQRLKNAALLGHCLLEPSHNVIERAYAALENTHSLAAADWYTLSAATANEPEQSLLHSVLAQLGAYVQSHPDLWTQYLNEVRHHLTHKNYQLTDLAATLSWLQSWQPKAHELPPRLQLQWQAARLACANHLGDADLTSISDCLTLGNSLMDEAAAEVCQADLRIAVAATNAFEFDTASSLLARWIDKPIAVAGLLNHAKVLSSLGQHHAFKGEISQALNYFDQALNGFSQLSDSQERNKESAQTQIYQLTALMDDPQTNTVQLQTALERYFNKPLDKVGYDLSNQANHTRYQHHLFVRSCVYFPELRSCTSLYIDNQAQWLTGTGHPWPLINAYRAWLLHSNPVHQSTASQLLSDAIDQCRDGSSGVIMQWMGEVLAVLAIKLGINAPKPNTENQARLKQQLSLAPWSALIQLQACKNDELLLRQAFSACLPFNFH